MSYANYDFYVDDYLLGKDAVIPESLFPYYASLASAEVKNVIRLDMFDTEETTKEMQMATCEIAEILCRADGNVDESIEGTGTNIPVGISSEKVGEYSVSYTGNTLTENDERVEKLIKKVVVRWLGPAGLLFRGVI